MDTLHDPVAPPLPADAAIAVDENQRIVLFNAAAERLFGRDARDVLGLPHEQLIPPRYRRVHAEMLRAFAASGAGALSMHERRPVSALRADGTEFQVAATISRAVAITAEGPRVVFLALMRPVGGHASLHADLARAATTVRALIDEAPVPGWIAQQGRVLSANRACAQLFELEPRALAGRDFVSLLDGASAAAVQRACAAALAQPGRACTVECAVLRPAGQRRAVELIVTALPAHGGDTVQMAFVDVTERRAEADALDRSRNELRRLAAHGVQAREDERRRIARELHDDVGQRLSVIKMGIAGLGGRDPGTAPAEPGLVDELLALVDDAVGSVRRIAAELRPTMLDDLGLFAALDWLGRSAARRLRMRVDVHLPALEPSLSPQAATALYRIVQESLANAAGPPAAGRVEIRARLVRAALRLSVRDDAGGVADPTLDPERAFGLLGMRELAHMAGGEVHFDNLPDGGGLVRVRVPIEVAAASAARGH